MTDLPLLSWALVLAALVIGILAGHFGWGKRWPTSLGKLHPDYLTGLDYLVTEQPDRALDMFLKLMDANAETIETHFALGSLYRRRGVYERQHDWQQALGIYRQLARIKAAPARTVAAHYLCEMASLAIERGDFESARHWLRDAQSEASPFPRAALLSAQIAEQQQQPDVAVKLIRQALADSPALLQEELPHLLKLVGAAERDAILAELVAQTELRGIGELKRLVFAAIAADLGDAAPLRTSIEKVFSQDATLQAVWKEGPMQSPRISQEIGALLAPAEKYPCNESAFSGRTVYWHCPALHAVVHF